MSIPDGFQRPPLRYKRFGGGYRREDVEFALAELGLTLRQLGQDLESLRDRNRELEEELVTARSEIESYRAKENELWQTMAAALRGAVEIEEGATARAREIVAQAEEEASRIRSEASTRLEESSARFNELVRLKDNLLEAMRRVVGDFGQAISRVERGEHLFPGVAQDPAGEAHLEPGRQAAAPAPADRAAPQPGTVSIPAAPLPPFPLEATAPPLSPPVSPPPLAPPAPAAAEEQVFETRLELDAGPFSDFAALSAFERALAHLAKVEDVYVRRVADDRALIELTLSEVAPFLQTMRESLPYTFDVRSASRSKIVVDVSVQTPAARP